MTAISLAKHSAMTKAQSLHYKLVSCSGHRGFHIIRPNDAELSSWTLQWAASVSDLNYSVVRHARCQVLKADRV